MAKKKQPNHVRVEQTLDEVFQYESRKRSTLDGIANAAMGGDRDALKMFAGTAVVLVEKAVDREPNGEFVEVAEWLLYVLSRIEGGEEPNDAFGWTKNGKGRPSVRSNIDALRKRWIIGQHIAGLLASNPLMSAVEAQRIAADKHHVSAEAARDYWDQWQGKKPIK